MLYLKRRCECLLDARVYWRFGYSDLKEAPLPEAALMGFLCSPGVLGGVVQVLQGVFTDAADRRSCTSLSLKKARLVYDLIEKSDPEMT